MTIQQQWYCFLYLREEPEQYQEKIQLSVFISISFPRAQGRDRSPPMMPTSLAANCTGSARAASMEWPFPAFGSLMFTASGKIPGHGKITGHPMRASSRSFQSAQIVNGLLQGTSFR
jgi:hypothetical protein